LPPEVKTRQVFDWSSLPALAPVGAVKLTASINANGTINLRMPFSLGSPTRFHRDAVRTGGYLPKFQERWYYYNYTLVHVRFGR
jgi:hypothetical protein